jgi:hypothetical protein
MYSIYEITNFLTPDELTTLDRLVAKQTEKVGDENLGRVVYTVSLTDSLAESIHQRIQNITGHSLPPLSSATFVDYDSRYGQPNLPPHFDGDNNGVIVDYQYKSNTSWGLGVNTTVYEMQDNKAVIFNPNQYPHWRPHKTFQDGEYVTMVFFRFSHDSIDYSDMRFSQDHEIFDEARNARDSYKISGNL